MPELRDLLEGAVDPPAPLDLDRLGRKVAAGRRRRRMTTVAAVLAVLLGGGALALRAGSDGRSDDVVLSPSASTTEGTPTTAATGPGGDRWPDCTEDDLRIVVDDAAEQPAFTVHPVAGAPECVLMTVFTFTFLDPVDLPNPIAMRTGMVWNQEGQAPMSFAPREMPLSAQPQTALGDCGLEAGQTYRARVDTTIEGFGPQLPTAPERTC